MTKTTKGIFLDTVLNDTPPNYLVFAKNLLLTEKLGVIQNEKGFTELQTVVPYPIVGLLPVFNRTVVWSTNDSFSEIGVITNNIYTKVLNDTDIGSSLGFKQASPIKAEFYNSAQGEVVVAWIDDINTPKIVNIDNPSLQANDLELFPAANLTTPSVSVNQTGGALNTGVYRLLYQYEDDDGSTSNYSALSKPVSIIKAASTDAVNLVWGNAANETTNKSINFTIFDVDINWSFINIVAVKTVNNITTVEQVAKLSTSAATFFITAYTLTGSYTGNEQAITLTLQEVLTPKAFYKNAKAITQLNNKLYLGNLTTEDEIQIQKFACNVKIQWRSILTSLLGNAAEYKERSGTDHSSFTHGEVYAFYLQVRDKKTGLWSKGYHIPGRAFVPGDDTILTPGLSGPFISGSGSPSFKRYQLDDTTTFLTVEPGIFHRLGTMGYWANTNEKYPNDDQYNGTVDYNGAPIPGGRDLRGQPVLHHKFPTLGYMRSSVYTGSPTYGKTELDILKIDISNVNLPFALSEKLSAWRVVYAKRDIGNATVLGTAPLFFFARGETTGQLKPVVTNGAVNQASAGDDLIMNLSTATAAEGSEFIRFHAFNLLIDKPSISPTYLRQEIGLNYISTTNSANAQDPRLLTDASGNPLVPRKWVLYSATSLNTITGPFVADRFRNVSFVQYLPNAGIISPAGSSKTINNVGGEDCVLLRNNITGISSNFNKFLNRVPSVNPFLYENSATHSTYISSLCALKSDVYNSFTSQTLITTDTTNNSLLSTGITNIGGGDSWVGYHSIHLQGPAADNVVTGSPTGNIEGEGCKGVHHVWSEAPKNLNYRYQDPADPQSSFYDATDLLPKIVSSVYATRYLGLMDLLKTPVYLYNNDYTTRAEIGINLVPFNIQTKTETKFPTTIAASITQGNESVVVNWKTFLISDRYTMPRNRGNLINLQGVGNQRLYIHHENSLFITKDRTTLKGDIVSVTLGSGNIFEVTPFEVLSTDQGYGGTQHKFACVLTKVGYVFPDASQGKWFIHNGDQLEEISKNGLRQFWRDNLDPNILDNPFNNNGITVVYDEIYNRLIMTANQEPGNFITASYSPQLEAWTSFHDYNPSFLYATRGNKTLSVKTTGGVSKIYQHNIGEYGKYYQTDTSRFPMIADVVYNINPYETKYFTSIGWVNEVYTPSNQLLGKETIDYLTARSANKTTGRIAISQFTELADVYAANARLTEKGWNFNQLRNVAVTPLSGDLVQDFYNNFNLNPVNVNTNKDWYDQGRMVDNFLVVRFEYSNLNNNKFLLLDHEVEERKSYRG